MKEAEKKAKQAIDKIIKPAVSAGEKALKAVTDGGDRHLRKLKDDCKRWIDDSANKTKNAVESSIKTVGGEVEGGLRKTGHEIEEGLTEKLPALAEDAVEKAVQELADAPIEAGLEKAADLCRDFHSGMEKFKREQPELTDAIDDTGFGFTLQAVVSLGLSYSGFYQRSLEVAGILDRYANEGVKPRRRDIIGLVRACGPTRVSLGAGAELSLGIQLGVEGSLDMPLELFLATGDVLLEKLGVPE